MMVPKTLKWIRGPFAGRALLEYVYFMQGADPLAKLKVDVQSAGLNSIVTVTGPDWFVDGMDEFIVANNY
jgi:hypothetical protein